MRISKESWHYRLVRWFDIGSEYGSTSLCRYFWQIVFAIFLCVGMGVGGIGAAIIVTLPLWHMFHWAFGLQMIAIFIGLCEIGILTYGLVTLVKERHWHEIRKGLREAPEPSLLYAWAKAKKDKVCPLVDFE